MEGVEEVVQIEGWLTKVLRKTRVRQTDITLRINGVTYRLDIKNWSAFPPQERQLKGAIDAMRRDLVIHLKEGSLDRLRWVFPESLGKTKAQRDRIIQELKKATYGREFRERLRSSDPGVYPVGPRGELALDGAVQKAREALDASVVRFHDLTLAAGS